MGALCALQPFGAVATAAGGPPRERPPPLSPVVTAGRAAAQVSSRVVLDGITGGNGSAPTAPVPAPTIALAALHLPVPLTPRVPLAPLLPLVGPPPVPQSVGVWAELRRCESGGNYATDTGNGYYGAYQFSLRTWQGLGYSGLPSDAPPAIQDQAASRLQARSGWGQWPACSRRLGL